MVHTRRIKDYQGFFRGKQLNEALGNVPSNGEFSPYSKVMLEWCGFTPGASDPQIYNLGIKGKDVEGEYNLFTSISPDDGGASSVFTILLQGDYLKELIRGSQKKMFRGPKAKILGDILMRLKKGSGGDYHESYMADTKEDDLSIYGSKKGSNEKWYRFIYKVSIEDTVAIMPMWSDFMHYIGFAPTSPLVNNKSKSGEYFGPGVMDKFFEKYITSNAKVKRLEVVFPGSWDEYAALQWAKEFGLMSPVFKSLTEGAKYLGTFKNVKFQEVVVGSHGDEGDQYGDMLSYEEGDDVTGFLNQLARVTEPDSKVYFTSCYGGDNEEKLVGMAKRLGCTVYASEGVNLLGFKSKKGKFWMAKPDGTYKDVGSEPPFTSTFAEGSILKGVAVVAKLVTQEQIDAISNYAERVSKEWKKFEKNPIGYTVDSCLEFLKNKANTISDVVTAPIKKAIEIWNAW
jgi:hypothetical protein